MDRIFSAQVLPLQRLEDFCNLIVSDQLKTFERSGKMLGCPFCSIGNELSTQDENIRKKAEQYGVRSMKYFETTLRDLAAQGLIEAADAHELSKELYFYVTGVLIQAKIENNPRIVEHLRRGVMRLLGVKSAAVAV